MGQEKQKGHYR